MICDQTCSNSFSLNRHLRTVHGSEHHQCRDCSKTYARYDTLKKHRRIRHQEIYETQTHQLIPVLTPESPEKRNETILSTSNHLLASPLTAPVQQGHSPRLASMNFDSTIQHSQNLGTAVEYLESGQQILIAPSFDANEEARAAEAWYDHVHDDVSSQFCTALIAVLINVILNSCLRLLHITHRCFLFQTLHEKIMRIQARWMPCWTWMLIQILNLPCHRSWSMRFRSFVKSTQMHT